MTIVDLPLTNTVMHLAEWLSMNVGPQIFLGQSEIIGKGWKLYYETAFLSSDLAGLTSLRAYTRCEFDKEEDATMFALRWS